jgi:hypothetical protein
MIVGGNGVGKTVGGQLVRGRLGLAGARFGQPLAAGSHRVLYLAMDRAAQTARPLHRTFTEDGRRVLDDRLVVWKGSPPLDLAKHPSVLAEMCADAGADTVVIDSLKDAAIGLSDNEVGAGWNRAGQGALVAGVEVLELHHNIKRATEGIADVYGSAWLTAGCVHDDGRWYLAQLLGQHRDRATGEWRCGVRYTVEVGIQHQRVVWAEQCRLPAKHEVEQRPDAHAGDQNRTTASGAGGTGTDPAFYRSSTISFVAPNR